MLKPIIEIDSSEDIRIPLTSPEVLRKFVFLRGDLVYPNTPIQVAAGEDRLHVYTEGQWDKWTYGVVPTTERLLWEQQRGILMPPESKVLWMIRNLRDAVIDTIKVNHSKWTSNPDQTWIGWKDINHEALGALLLKLGPSEAQADD